MSNTLPDSQTACYPRRAVEQRELFGQLLLEIYKIATGDAVSVTSRFVELFLNIPPENRQQFLDYLVTDDRTSMLVPELVEPKINSLISTGHNLAVVHTDLVRFGKVNEDLGHIEGHKMLLLVGNSIKRTIRSKPRHDDELDLLFGIIPNNFEPEPLSMRNGGDEAIIIMPLDRILTEMELKNLLIRILYNVLKNKKLARYVYKNKLYGSFGIRGAINQWGSKGYESTDQLLADTDPKHHTLAEFKYDILPKEYWGNAKDKNSPFVGRKKMYVRRMPVRTDD